MNIISLFKTVRSPDGTEMKSNFPSFFPDRAAELLGQGPATSPPPPGAATCQHQAREMPGSSPA